MELYIYYSWLATFCSTYLENYTFVMVVAFIALCIKAYLTINFLKKALSSDRVQQSWILLLLVLFGTMMSNSAWLLVAVNELYIPDMSYGLRSFWLRLTWACDIIYYQAMALFIESLLEKQFRLRFHNLLFLLMSAPFVLFFLFIAVTYAGFTHTIERWPLEIVLQRLSPFVEFPPVIFSILFALYTVATKELPRITKQQIKVLLPFLIIPNTLVEMIQIINWDFGPTWITNSLTASAMSMLIFTCVLVYCTRKVIGFRFLNMDSQVKSSSWFSFFDNFKTVLDHLSHVTTLHELEHITQTFFKESFAIPLTKSHLYIRQRGNQKLPISDAAKEQIETLVEKYLTNHAQSSAIMHYITTNKILTYDEILFTNFHEENELNTALLQFLDQINADLFLPVREQHTIIAYLIIDRNARIKELFTNIERDEMLVFANYLGTIMHLLQQRNIDTLMRKQQEMEHEIYTQQEQLAQYQETMQSFLRSTEEKEIGLIFYTHQRFSLGNKAARTLITINLNTQSHNSIVNTCRRLVNTVLEYQAAQSMTAYDHDNQQLIFSAIPMPEHQGVVIAVHRPEMSDIIKQQSPLSLGTSQGNSNWNTPHHRALLLHMATTHLGKQINSFIPCSTDNLLPLKINLMQAALSKRATVVISSSDNDIEDVVTILHEASNRNLLHHIVLTDMEDLYEIPKKLFGINPLLNQYNKQPALLKKLDGVGTLFLKNIHLLDKETQKSLAEFIRYGYYRVFKTDNKITSDVRIICSTHRSLSSLVQEGTLIKELYEELTLSCLMLPSVATMQPQDFAALIHAYLQDIVHQNGCNELPTISSSMSYHLMQKRPASFKELKKSLTKALAEQQKDVTEIAEVSAHTQPHTYIPATQDTYSPELMAIAHMGKKALRDPEAMMVLWKTFKNQNQIADFLNVNRSSVSRRCKEFNLG